MITSRFTGRVALVKGAGGGIGGAIALRLATEGAHVVVADVREDLAAQTVDAVTAAGKRNLARTGRTKADLDALVLFGRIGEPEEIAALVAFLASDEAPFLTGSVVEITGAQAVS